jgi:hypothetical protein
MAVTKVLARKWLVEIAEKEAVPAFATIKGINTLTFSNDKEDVETTDFDNDGRPEHQVAQRSNELSIEGFYLEDPTTKARDAGQQLVEDAGNAIGEASLYVVRLTSPAGSIKTFDASVNVGDVGGGNNDATSWGATFTVSGSIATV